MLLSIVELILDLYKNGYDHMLSARSLQDIVKKSIKDEVCHRYLDIEEIT